MIPVSYLCKYSYILLFPSLFVIWYPHTCPDHYNIRRNQYCVERNRKMRYRHTTRTPCRELDLCQLIKIILLERYILELLCYLIYFYIQGIRLTFTSFSTLYLSIWPIDWLFITPLYIITHFTETIIGIFKIAKLTFTTHIWVSAFWIGNITLKNIRNRQHCH